MSSLLEAKGVQKIFKRRGTHSVDVLRSVDFVVEAGDRIAILGKSGAGKSTLLHILGTLETPTRGTVHFHGEDVFRFGEAKLSEFRNREIGFVFQFHYLMLEFDALENVMMPAILGGMPSLKAKAGAAELLARVGLSERLSHRPSQLSGGEQQRVAIARALMNRPKILLTDEMTGNLDPSSGSKVFQLVQSIHAEFQMALISVTHDESLASVYPKIYKLQQGRLVVVK